MSTRKPEDTEDLREEYRFERIPGGVRGNYLRQHRAGTNLALLDPDIAAAFPSDTAVNEALRAILRAAAVIRLPRGRSSAAAPRRSGGDGRVSERTKGENGPAASRRTKASESRPAKARSPRRKT